LTPLKTGPARHVQFDCGGIVEKLDVKKALFAELETYVDVNAVLASNTSCAPSQHYQAGMSIQSVLLDIIFSTRFALIEGCKCGTGRNKS
jgi:hypothetical protein